MPSFPKTPFAVLASVAILGVAGCDARGAVDPRTGPQLVRVATAGSASSAALEFTGIVSARVQSDLGFRVSGKVVERFVDAGQAVRRGQPLMRIDRTDLALVESAAKARAVQAAADEKRYRDLVSAGAVSASAYDQAKATADAAQAQLSVARNEAGYSILRADADGVVIQTLAEPGQVVAAAQTVVRLARSGPREAAINLPETLRPAIGSTARATLFNSTAEISARLRQLSNAADPLTRTYDARYVLEGAADAPLGSTVTIKLTDNRATPAMELPLAAIYDNGKGPGVWVVQGERSQVAWRPVKLAGLGDETATVTGGIRAGEQFVALGAHLLHQGQLVRISADQGAGK